MTIRQEVEHFCRRLQRRQLEGSLNVAKATAEIMRLLVTSQRHADAQALLDDVRAWGTQMQTAKPLETAIGNMVRRVLHIIREESQQENEMPESTQNTATVATSEIKAGLLSQAFQPLQARSVSLHNLLDMPPSATAAPAVVDGPHGLPQLAESAPDGDDVAAGPDRAGGERAGGTWAPDAVAVRPSEVPGGLPERPSGRDSEAGDGGEAGGDGSVRPRRERHVSWPQKAAVIDQLNELIDELKDIDSNIALRAVEHIHASEVILTFGMSDTVLAFLLEASKKRSFQVVVAEGAPAYGGHRMARSLATAGVHTTAIPDAAIFAMMARVNKVLVGAHTLLANGGVMAAVGSNLVALAAQRHAVPFVVLAGLHKLSPLFPHDPSLTFNEFKSPADVIDFSVIGEAMGAMTSTDAGSAASPVELYVHVPNPALDYVPPELVSLFVTDTGGYTPAYVYRLLAEFYSREDYMLSKELLDALIR